MESVYYINIIHNNNIEIKGLLYTLIDIMYIIWVLADWQMAEGSSYVYRIVGNFREVYISRFL